MDYKELVKKFEEHAVTPEMLAHVGDRYFWFDDEDAGTDEAYEAVKADGFKKYDAFIADVGPVATVARKGGTGQGEEWYSVAYFEEHDVYIKVDAFYTSYSGADFDDAEFKEVRPQQKTITVYE
jgi:hypothetical protein